jgi:hypothetical protein
MQPSVPACVVPTQIGKPAPAVSITTSVTRSRSRSVSLSASPSTPRMVMPFTRVPRVNSVSRRKLGSSSAPSGVNGVGVML